MAWGVVTDNGNQILDVHDLQIADPVGLEREVNQIVGVVTVGLFAMRGADVLIVGTGMGWTLFDCRKRSCSENIEPADAGFCFREKSIRTLAD